MSNPQVPISGSIGSAGPFPTLGATVITLADAPHTLADPSETCYQYILVNGSQTAPRQITGPLVAGFTYLVINETTGGFDIVFGGATGTTVSIPPGQSTWCSTDGTNWTQTGGGGSSPVAGSAGYVIFRPGVASTGQAVATPAELITASENGAQVLYVDSSVAAATFPSGFTLPFFAGGVVGFHGESGGFANADTLTVADGAQLTNPSIFLSLHLVLDCVTTPAFVYSAGAHLLRVTACEIALAVGAGVPAYTVASGVTLEIQGIFSIFTSAAAFPVFSAASGGVLIGVSFQNTTYAADSITAAAGSTFVFEYDGSAPPGGAGFTVAGTYIPIQSENDQNLSYGNGTAFPATSPGGQTLRVGQPFFRTDLNQLFTWSGTAWVAAGGTTSLFIFRPGGVEAGNVYTSEADLAAAVGPTMGSTIVFDFALVAGSYTFTTVGAFNLGISTNWVLGDSAGGETDCGLVFSNGTTLTHPPASIISVADGDIQVEQAVALITTGDEVHCVIDNTGISVSGAGNFWAEVGGVAFIYLRGTTTISSAGPGFVFGGTVEIQIYVEDSASVQAGAVALTGVSLLATSSAATIDPSLYTITAVQGLYVDTSGTGAATLPPAESTDQLLFSSSTFFTSNGAAWIALSGGSVLPLSRTLFVDGGTSAISHDGSIAAPYLTISAALAVFGQPVSTEDADTVVQAWIASALGGYTAEPGTVIPIPAYRQVWVQGISQEAGLVTTLGTLGPSTTATLTWANTAANGGANPPAEVSSLVVYSLQVPAITVTDDGTSPEIIILDQAHVSGAIDASGATAFGEVVLQGESAVAGGINTPTGAVIVLGTSTVTGAITASQLEVSGGSVSAGVFTIASTIELSNGADFNPGANPFTCANFSATNATIEGATGTVSGDVNGSYSDFVSGALHSATMEFAYCSFGPGIAFVATGAVTANGCQFDSGTLTCASMSMLNCTFGFPDVGFQITATTITTDFESWQSYIGQGGLPNGATVTIIDRAPPLSRTMFVDGGSTGVDPSGQVLAPFHTISAGIAPFATQPVSTEDADSTVQVWVTPVLGGYESEPGSVINIPAYRQVVIQGTSEHSQFFGVAGIVGTSTNATLTWANTAANGGANPPTALTTLIISWMGVEGITITDDASSPEFLFLEGVFLPNIGTIDGTGATDLEAIFLDNECTVVGTIDAPSAGVVIQGSSVVEGSITAASVECNLCEVSGALALNATAGNIEFNSGANINDVTYNSETFSATGALVTGSTGTVTGDSEITTTQFIDGTLKSATATITNCTFSAGFQLTITDTLSIDAESWVNYLAQGGSPGTVNTFSIIGQTAKGYVTSPFPQNLTITPGLPDQFIAAFNLTPTQTGNLDVAGTFLVQPTTPDTPEYVILVYVGTATGGTPSGPNCLLGSDTAQIAPPAGTPTPVMAFEPLPTTAASEDNLSVTIAALVTGLDLGTQYAIVIGCASPGGAVWTYSANVRVFENPVN